MFCDTRDDAAKVADGIRKLAKQPDLELFVGGRRAYERTALATWLEAHGFIAGAQAPTATAYLVATSAAEVGVNLDADAAVADVVAWERMVQRLGRVNRRGNVTARVVLIPIEGEERAPERREACLTLLGKLPALESGRDGSPAALGALRRRADHDSEIARLIEQATTPAPLHPPLSRPLVDAWAMTWLDKHTGRPEVAPWLRGWVEDEEPQVKCSFRDELPLVRGKLFDPKSLDAFLDVAGPHAAEELETEVRRVVNWLEKRLEAFTKTREQANRNNAQSFPLALALDRDGAPRLVTQGSLQDKRERRRLERWLAGGRLIVDARVGGLRLGHARFRSRHTRGRLPGPHDSRGPGPVPGAAHRGARRLGGVGTPARQGVRGRTQRRWPPHGVAGRRAS